MSLLVRFFPFKSAIKWGKANILDISLSTLSPWFSRPVTGENNVFDDDYSVFSTNKKCKSKETDWLVIYALISNFSKWKEGIDLFF